MIRLVCVVEYIVHVHDEFRFSKNLNIKACAIQYAH